MRYLTKSRFNLALECLTKLYYTRKEEYSDESIDDPFLIELAKGGFQVGELAKFLFCDDPIKEQITIESLDYEKSLDETASRLWSNDDAVVAEAAFCSGSLFIRTDIVVKAKNHIDLYEVKAKSIDRDTEEFITKKGKAAIASRWVPYLYDVAFQKYVISKALSERKMTIAAHLILVDKSNVATMNGLNQKFKIYQTRDRRPRVEVEKGLKAGMLGDPILKVINVDSEIDRIWNEFPVPTDYGSGMTFEEFVQLCSSAYSKDERILAPLGQKCKACQYVNSNPAANPKKSGFLECWKHKTGLDESLLAKDTVLDLWGGMSGSRSLVNELISQGKYRLETIAEQDIAPKSQKETIGLSPHVRRVEQVTRAKEGNTGSFFDAKGLQKEMSTWNYPLHMIDFETTMTALPVHKGRHPYEGIAFQFSHHTIDAKGKVAHAGQFLSFEPGAFPNYDFVRNLKKQLEHDSGSIFRYHHHENTYLNIIWRQLESDPEPPEDKEELQSFIRSITNWKEIYGGKETKKQGERCMIDLYQLVLDYYMPPSARGSNSIKQILPAIVQDSEFLRTKYGQPVYGREKEVKSLNFEEHVWIDSKLENDPYKTLPRLFERHSAEELDKLVFGVDSIDDGGTAMMAYNRLQFSEIPQDQRAEIKNGLLRYCELDTMAMVMIVEGWKHF